ncbi:tetratricopeptide repeat protein [Pedobacter sp. MW01-1-1]|uniref:tetratricopeptide repeat protein n=1 Tax=Pedobacter sp. MW01-1-1 TaxID=3383027 RepID=UPI003FF111D6
MKNLVIFTISLLISYAGFAQNAESIDKEKLFDLYQNQRYADAIIYLKKFESGHTPPFTVVTQIGYCYLMAGNTAEAEKQYQIAHQQQPKNLSILFSLANISARRGNTKNAKSYFGEIVKIDSNNFMAYKALANLYIHTKDSVKLMLLKKANQINPTESDVASDLADEYMLWQKPENAYSTLDVAIKADTGNLILQKAILDIALKLKKYKEVIRSGTQILKTESDANVTKNVAIAYYFTKNYQKSIDLFKLLEGMAMQNEGTLYYTCLCYRGLKNWSMATIYAKKTIGEGISPNIPNYYALLGLTYEDKNQNASAKAAYLKGLQFNAEPVLYYRLAILYDTKYKQVKSAKKYYQLYLKSNPDLEKDEEEINFTKKRIEQLNLSN